MLNRNGLAGRKRTRWLFYKNGRGFELRTYQEQIRVAVRVGLPLLWAAGLLKVQRSDFLATLPNNKRHHRESVAMSFNVNLDFVQSPQLEAVSSSCSRLN